MRGGAGVPCAARSRCAGGCGCGVGGVMRWYSKKYRWKWLRGVREF